MAAKAEAITIRTVRQFKNLYSQINLILNSQLLHTALNNSPSPVFNFGTGGSGTRIVVDVLQHGGYYMGWDLNQSNDALSLTPIIHRWIPIYLEAPSSFNIHFEAFQRDFTQVLLRHRLYIPKDSTPWGVKNPRQIFLFPLLIQMFPTAQFIHVIRDRRDMAFSNNQAQVQTYRQYILDKSLINQPLPLQSMALWSRVNSQAARTGQSIGSSQYFMLQFETLCFEPESTIQTLYEFLHLNVDHHSAARLIDPPSTIGRWRDQDMNIVDKLHQSGHEALTAFGYLDS